MQEHEHLAVAGDDDLAPAPGDRRTICRAARAVDMIRNFGIGSGVSARSTPSLSTRRISEAT